MKIKKMVTYIMENEDGEKAIPIGESATLLFHDGTYHTGDIEKLTEDSVTISRDDGDYTYYTDEIQAIRMSGL